MLKRLKTRVKVKYWKMRPEPRMDFMGKKYNMPQISKKAGSFIRELDDYSLEPGPWAKLYIGYDKSLTEKRKIRELVYSFKKPIDFSSCVIYEHEGGLVITNSQGIIVGFFGRKDLPSLTR